MRNPRFRRFSSKSPSPFEREKSPLFGTHRQKRSKASLIVLFMGIVAGERLFAEGVMAGEEGGEGFGLSVALIGFCGAGGVLFLCEGRVFRRGRRAFRGRLRCSGAVGLRVI